MQRLTHKSLGSAKTGVGHWIHQRASAAFLLYLNLWLIYFVSHSVGVSYADQLRLAADACNAVHILLYIGTALYHAKLGLQTVIEDYCHCPAAKTLKLLAMNFVVYAAGAYGAVSLVRIIAKGVAQ